jgi:hypothetical protein
MIIRGWRYAILSLGLLLCSGCAFRNFVADQTQIDSMTYCDLGQKERSFGAVWGRRAESDKKPATVWSHFSLGEFACKTQDEWLCQARTGGLDCTRARPFRLPEAGDRSKPADTSKVARRRLQDGSVAKSLELQGATARRVRDEAVVKRSGTREFAERSSEAEAAVVDPWGRDGKLDSIRDETVMNEPKVSDATLRRYRNETVTEMMMQSDRICDRHLASIFGTQASVGLSTDIAGSLLSGGAAIASGIAARNLTAGAAMVGATKSHISADVYQGKVATAINLIIRKERNATRAVLRSNQSCSPSTYTAAEAVQDTLNYHNMCSFEYGLSELVREASDTSPLRAPLAASLLARTEAELRSLNDQLAKFKGSDSEKSELKSRIERKLGQIELFRAFGVSDVALPVVSSGSSDGSGRSVAPVAVGPVMGAAAAAPVPSVEQRSCD